MFEGFEKFALRTFEMFVMFEMLTGPERSRGAKVAKQRSE